MGGARASRASSVAMRVASERRLSATVATSIVRRRAPNLWEADEQEDDVSGSILDLFDLGSS
jgi:hypothetical protein